MNMNKTAKNNKINTILNNIQDEIHEIRKEATHDTIEQQTTTIIRELRQGIERLRRLIEPEDKINQPLKFDDISKLGRDELAYIVRKFWKCSTSEGADCPRQLCNDYFCCHCQNCKEECDENLANGDLSPEDYNKEAERGFFDDECNLNDDGCWADYYLWCYRNDYNPDTGKKNDKTEG